MKKSALLPLFVCVLSATGSAQGDPATLGRIIEIGKNDSHVMQDLDELANGIGSRLTGSPRLDKAEAWALRKFQSYGLSNVHLEKWGEVPVSWQREPDTSGRMIAPFQLPITFTSPDWTEGTNGPLRGPAILAPKTEEEFEKVKDRLAGAWVVTPGAPRRRPATAGATASADETLREKIDAAGIAGRVYGSRNDLVVTYGTWAGKTMEKHPLDRSVIVSRTDMDRIQRNLEFGRTVTLEFNLHHTWRKGPKPVYNVVADLVGTEKPDEIVIVSGHLDSWDGPGSQGALDNGVGACTAIDAARILTKAGAKPKRTIRFILWTGEEQGLLGSRPYVEAHKAEMDKISAVLVDDGGTGYHGGYIGPESMKAMMMEAYAPTEAAFPELPMTYRVVSSIRRQESGSDHASFWKYGVPGFFTIEGDLPHERLDYNYIHHTQHDRFEMAHKGFLIQSATNHAVVSYNLACAATLLPRDGQPPRTGSN